MRQIIKSPVLKLFVFFRYYVDLIFDKIFSLYWDSQREYIKPPKNPILLKSATELAKKIRNKDVTVEEVIKAYIDRINEVNPVLNALVDNRFIEALDEARQMDMDIATGVITDADFERKPFLGIPFTTKETTEAVGMSHTFGLLCRRGKKGKVDAECVRKLKDAGGILLGVTNIPQLNMWCETSNPVFGITKNPHNTTRHVGGSSGGEAALLAAHGNLLSISSDIGGSIRIPAFACGVFGHKPTCGLITTQGFTYRTGKEKQTIISVGPIARTVDDLTALFKVLLGPNIKELKLDEPVDIKDIKIYWVRDPKDPMVCTIRDEMHNCMKRAVQFFEMRDVPPKEIHLEGFSYSGRLWRYWIGQEPFNFLKDLTDRQSEVSPVWEIIKKFLFFSKYTMGSIYNIISKLLPPEDETWAIEKTEKLKKELLDILGTNGVLLYPSAPFAASYHHSSLLRPWNFNFFAIWNAVKFPATQVPMNVDQEGMPIGIQVVAPPNQDHLCLAVARELEKVF